jgi:hypothetical protein
MCNCAFLAFRPPIFGRTADYCEITFLLAQKINYFSVLRGLNESLLAKFRSFKFLLAQKINDFSVLRGLNESLANNVLHSQNFRHFAAQAGR